MPIVPVHGWLADAHAEAPTAGSVDLSGILLKTAAYGLLRFNLPLFPEASALLAPVAMWLGLITVFYAALLAFRQTDIKRLAAYSSSISHMGFYRNCDLCWLCFGLPRCDYSNDHQWFCLLPVCLSCVACCMSV